MAKGTVTRVIRDRGFGFIRTEEGQEIFFHHTSVPDQQFDSLNEGSDVEFETEKDPRGRGNRATNVRVAS